MTGRVDKALVRRRFSEAAATYDAHSPFQRRAADRLLAALPETVGEIRVLDVGCGTGEVTRQIALRYPQASVTGIDIAPGMIVECRRNGGRGLPRTSIDRPCGRLRWYVADAEQYRPRHRFGLVTSNCAVQWFADRDRLPHCLSRLTESGGRIAFTVPVEGTFCELADAFVQSTGERVPGLTLWSPAALVSAFDNSRVWRLTHASVEDIEIEFPRPIDVLRHIKGIGASCGGYPGVSDVPMVGLRRTLAAYSEQFAVGSGVTATYRIMLIQAEKTGG